MWIFNLLFFSSAELRAAVDSRIGSPRQGGMSIPSLPLSNLSPRDTSNRILGTARIPLRRGWLQALHFIGQGPAVDLPTHHPTIYSTGTLRHSLERDESRPAQEEGSRPPSPSRHRFRSPGFPAARHPSQQPPSFRCPRCPTYQHHGGRGCRCRCVSSAWL